MSIEKVGIVGGGQMGGGIAEVCAKSGYETVVREVEQEFLDKGMARIGKSLDRALSKEKIDQETRDATWKRLSGTTELSDLAGCDVVIEAIVENLEAKRSTFAELDGIVGPEAIFASNTSSLTITDIALGSGATTVALGADTLFSLLFNDELGPLTLSVTAVDPDAPTSGTARTSTRRPNRSLLP